MSLSRYWPESAQVSACIRTEAETIDEAILLAVHEPTRIIKRSASGAMSEDKNEQELLDALLRDNTDGSAVVVSLTGPSGVGKSHMVRWLQAQLSRHPRRDQMVVILIPKTASLRQVVELILEPLRGEEYDNLRIGLDTAIASISPEAAPAWLATELGLQLKRKAEDWYAELRASSDPTLKGKAFHAKSLEVLLGDYVFRDGMLNLALERIVSRAVIGDKTGSTHLPQFEVGDFVWNSSKPITDATRPAQHYYQRLCDNDGEARAIAVDVINTVIDPAMRAVFRFSHALGGKSIEDIVSAIRVQLHGENKELVLLVEDFAALSGFQEPLLSLIIAESDDQNGERVRAPIRTALAVTDGFMPQRDTILTRAKGEWVISSVYSSDEELLVRLVEMAGRYLNVARWGREAIRNQFHERPDQSNTGLYGWVKPYIDDHLDAADADRLKAFGSTSAGYSLFPFNEYALHSLCRKELMVAGNLVFNPRAFINQVLRETLDQRHYYEREAFPPAGFKGGILPSGAETYLDGMVWSPAQKARLKPMLIHWCGNPKNLSTETPVGAPVFEAFSLPFPFLGVPRSPDKILIGTDTGTEPVQPVRKATAFELAIESWGGSKLPQAQARNTRLLLGAAVGRRLDLSAAMTKKVTELIWLPYVDHANPQTQPMFRLAEETGSVPGWLRTALIGLARCDDNKGWDYQGAENDYGFAQRLLDQFTPLVEQYLYATVQKRLATVMFMLHRQNLMFGIGGVRALPTAFDKMFEKVGGEYNEADFMPSSNTDCAPILGKALAHARAMRSLLQDMILQGAACFQGDGNKPMAIDHARVAAAWASGPDDAIMRDGSSTDLAAHLSELSANFSRLLGNFNALLANHGNYFCEALGINFNKETWVASIRQALRQALAQAYLPTDFVLNQDFARLDDLYKSALTELARNVQAAMDVPTEAGAEDRMRAYGKVDLVLLLRSTRNIRRLQTLLDGASKYMVGAEQQAQRDEVGEVRASIVSEMRDAATLLKGEME